MSFRSTLSGYPKILNVWSIYFQYCNSQASKQNKELLGFVYGHIPYIPLNNKMNIQDMLPFHTIS